MGSLLVYELYYEINKMEIKNSKYILFSGYKGPNIIRNMENKMILL